MFTNMKISYFYSFVLASAAVLGMSGCGSMSKNNEKQPVNTGTKTEVKELLTETDTFYITKELLDSKKVISAGVFTPYRKKITVRYFIPMDNDAKTIYFCNNNNNQIRLILRHEIEHARKENLTKNTNRFSPFVRGAVAVQNEIMAPAAEIIEALDYHYETGHPYPSQKKFIIQADKKITAAANKQHLEWPLDFNNTQIADIILQCATEQYLGEVSRGIYKKVIRDELDKEFYMTSHNSNNLCAPNAPVLFQPEIGLWQPLWDFQSKRGPVNLWNAASTQQKKRLIHATDSIVKEIAGKHWYNIKNNKTH